jgi:hypothetical protein
MVSSFSKYLQEEDKVAYYTFGRLNPPTIGHEKLLDSLAQKAGKNDYFAFLSQSQDKKKNPLDYSTKIKQVRKMFPRHARRVIISKSVRTVFDASTYLYDKGYRSVVFVAGSDRVREFETLLNKYNGVKGAHGFYNFKSISVVSAGERDPDAEGVSGMSASKMRKAASENDFVSFSQGLPPAMANKDAKKLFIDVRNGMGLKENTVFKRHIELESVSEEREQFVQGKLFEIGDTVIIKESDEMGIITYFGTNYVVVELDENRTVKKWLNAVEKTEPVVREEKVGTRRFSDIKKKFSKT